MTDQQIEAVTATEPLVIATAVPGAGKTTCLCGRIQRIVADGVPRGSIHGITFTTAAAGELRHRLAKLGVDVSNRGPIGYLGTIHGWALRFIQKHYHAAGYKKAPAVLSEAECDTRIAAARKEARTQASVTKDQMTAAIARNPVANTPAFQKPVDIAARTYLRQCVADAVIDFDSMLSWATFILRVKRIAIDYTPPLHLLVDEVQDCCESDFTLIHAIGAKNLFMVGDVKQAVYQWRGGDPYLLLGMIEENPNIPGQKRVVRLTKNFRSGATVCAAADAVIASGDPRFAETMEPAVPNKSGPVGISEFATQQEEYRDIAICVRALNHDDLDASSAILCRTNFEVESVGMALASEGVPCRVMRTKDEQLPGWDVAMDALSLAASPDNESAAKALCARVHGAASASEEALAKMAGVTLAEHLLGYRGALRSLPDALSRLKVPSDTIRVIEAVAARLPDESTFEDLIIATAGMGRETAVDGPQGAVQVMTIHKSKGQEFDHVWLPGWGHGIFPDAKEAYDDACRLAYVAVTRARIGCHISWSRSGQYSRFDKAPVLADGPSEFIEAITKATA